MFQEPTYIIENGRYAFYLRGERMFDTDVVAILFDRDQGVLLKHGKPENVQATFDKYKRNLANVEEGSLILESLTVIEGAFEVEELNKVVNISGYVSHLFKQIADVSQTLH